MLEGDNTESNGWMSEEERQVSAEVVFYLGHKYEFGDGVQQDYLRAAELYHEAASQGSATAQCNLGYMIEHRKGVAEDLSRAAEWYQCRSDTGILFFSPGIILV